MVASSSIAVGATIAVFATDPGVGDPPCAFDGTGCSDEELAGFDADGRVDPAMVALGVGLTAGGIAARRGPEVLERRRCRDPSRRVVEE